MTASETSGGSYVNVRSEECSAESKAAATERGLRVVWYGGQPYLLVGVYFAPGPYGRRELRYILRSTQSTSETPVGALREDHDHDDVR